MSPAVRRRAFSAALRHRLRSACGSKAMNSEGGLVVVGARGATAAAAVAAAARGCAPRVVLRRGLRTTAAATTAADLAAASAATTARAGDLGGRVAERGADLVDLELDRGAVLALAVLVAALLE